MKTQEKITIDSPVHCLPYANSKVEKLLNKLGIKTIRDLLLHPPSRYLDFSNIAKIKDVKPGETVTIQGQIISIANKRTWKRKLNLTEAIIEDGTGSIKAIWFNQPFIAHRLRSGQFANFSGKISAKDTHTTGFETYFSNPTHELIGKTELAHTGIITPVYPETAGLTSRWIRFLMKHALKYVSQMQDIVPQEIIFREKLLPIKETIKNLHFPASLEIAKAAKKQLAFEEMLIIQLMVLRSRKEIKSQKAPPIKTDIELTKKFVSRLPFELTNAQRKSAWQILKDMENPNPMNRLLNGDVGSGKTIVAAIAALNASCDNRQVAYLAPTEILTNQHFQTFCKSLQSFNLTIALATGSENKIFDSELCDSYEVKKPELLKKINNGQINIVIGTHAIIQDGVKFSNLGLVIIDEQHRFGVAQRAALLKNNEKDSCLSTSRQNPTTTGRQAGFQIPHLLSMTATPIPRTLMLTVYGDLDISILDEMPKNRQKIITQIVSAKDRKKSYDFIRQEIKNGRQAFVVCPRIENTTEISQPTATSTDIKTVKEEYKKLSEEIFPDLRIGMLHGKLKPKEKEKIMVDFKNNKTDILVATSVIEVGIDVPNATVMLIEEADRFGLAQLHQFRGRIGRGQHQSYCLLATNSEDKSNCERLKALVNSENGFKIAEYDLELRGPGQFLGERQWGMPDMAFASFADVFLLQKVRDYASDLLNNDPELIKCPELKNRVINSQSKIHLE